MLDPGPRSRVGIRLAAAAALALLFSGCVSERLPTAVDDESSQWTRIETEHFVVETNAQSTSRVHDIASDFETLWHAFAAVPVLGRRPPSVKPIVVVFADRNEYRYFYGGQTAGLLLPETALGPLIALPPNSGPFRDISTKHELAHFMCSEFLPDAPMWLHEGLAQVMETADYDTSKGEILFGDFLPGRVLTAGQTLSAERFMEDWPRSMTGLDMQEHYAKSWLLVHYLIDHHLQDFLDFEVRISRGQDWRTAWAGEIPVKFDQLDDTLESYHRKAKYGLWTVRAELPDMDAFVESIVPPADVFALRSVLHAYATNPQSKRSQMLDSADRDLATAIELDPENGRVQQIKSANAAASP